MGVPVVPRPSSPVDYFPGPCPLVVPCDEVPGFCVGVYISRLDLDFEQSHARESISVSKHDFLLGTRTNFIGLERDFQCRFILVQLKGQPAFEAGSFEKPPRILALGTQDASNRNKERCPCAGTTWTGNSVGPAGWTLTQPIIFPNGLQKTKSMSTPRRAEPDMVPCGATREGCGVRRKGSHPTAGIEQGVIPNSMPCRQGFSPPPLLFLLFSRPPFPPLSRGRRSTAV